MMIKTAINDLILITGEADGAVEVHHVTERLRARGADRWVRQMQPQLPANGAEEDAPGRRVGVE